MLYTLTGFFKGISYINEMESLTNSDTLTGLLLSSFISCIATVPQHLGGVAEPLAVLRHRWLACFNLAGGYQVCEPFLAPDNVHGFRLAEGKVRHYIEDILQQYLRGVYLGYPASPSHGYLTLAT